MITEDRQEAALKEFKLVAESVVEDDNYYTIRYITDVSIPKRIVGYKAAGLDRHTTQIPLTNDKTVGSIDINVMFTANIDASDYEKFTDLSKYTKN